MVNGIFKKYLIGYLEKYKEDTLNDNDDSIGYKKVTDTEIKNFNDFLQCFIIKKGGVENILMKYEDSIDGKKFSSHNREQYILGLTTLEKLKERDYKRYILGSVPFVNYTLIKILKSVEFNEEKLEHNNLIQFDYLSILDDTNPFKQKYNKKEIETLEEKFECIRDYINEISFAKDAAGIGGMSGATDFLQLYKFVMDEDIIENTKDRKEIIEKLFKVLKSNDISIFIINYKSFIKTLEKYNKSTKRSPDGKVKNVFLTRLYNRLYFIFSFILNNQNPEEFPIYFSATRNTLKLFGIEGYENITKVYKKILELKIGNEKGEELYKKYLDSVGINKEKYCSELSEKIPFNENLFTNHAKYRFFQDLCWILNRNVIDGQDFINNLGKGQKFNFEELKEQVYLGSIKLGDIFNLKYLSDPKKGGYIKEISSGEYEVIYTDTYFIKDINPQQ